MSIKRVVFDPYKAAIENIKGAFTKDRTPTENKVIQVVKGRFPKFKSVLKSLANRSVKLLKGLALSIPLLNIPIYLILKKYDSWKTLRYYDKLVNQSLNEKSDQQKILMANLKNLKDRFNSSITFKLDESLKKLVSRQGEDKPHTSIKPQISCESSPSKSSKNQAVACFSCFYNEASPICFSITIGEKTDEEILNEAKKEMIIGYLKYLLQPIDKQFFSIDSKSIQWESKLKLLDILPIIDNHVFNENYVKLAKLINHQGASLAQLSMDSVDTTPEEITNYVLLLEVKNAPDSKGKVLSIPFSVETKSQQTTLSPKDIILEALAGLI